MCRFGTDHPMLWSQNTFDFKFKCEAQSIGKVFNQKNFGFDFDVLLCTTKNQPQNKARRDTEKCLHGVKDD